MIEINKSANEVVETKIIENKEIELNIKPSDFLETSSEVKFTSMALHEFPIKYRNFSKELEPLKSNFLGITDVDFGFMKLEGVLVKVLDFLDFKLIEFRKKDFRIAIDEKDSLFEYEIYKDVKNKRLEEIFDFFAKFFKASTIKFKIANDKYEYYFHNNIEYYKFITLGQFLTQYTNLISELKLYRYKNLSSAKNTFFELDLLDKSSSEEETNIWINAEIKSDIDVNTGDSLIIRRFHKINFNDFPYDVEEIITLVHPLTEEEIKDNIIKLTRKSVKIKLRRVHK
ncbi:hypothetical protein [Fusobacterium periodonticum]|uniref:Uncharacterized protein n=1 Tax=Fusobacterium periodonticum 1_1_41FAA TaxID=469621 RepID=D6LJW5_9FUSO|nr:hypothetical protein [Fusobacterium periodonticum]EFG27481.1 hypothetical protein HMPREF0400_01888 [Fusobacterium periodonticum 1_1_41FAA]